MSLFITTHELCACVGVLKADSKYVVYSPTKHQALNQCRYHAGPASQTMGQHYTNIGSASRVAGMLVKCVVSYLKWQKMIFASALTPHISLYKPHTLSLLAPWCVSAHCPISRLPLPRRLCGWFCWLVCLSVCPSVYPKSNERICRHFYQKCVSGHGTID